MAKPKPITGLDPHAPTGENARIIARTRLLPYDYTQGGLVGLAPVRLTPKCKNETHPNANQPLTICPSQGILLKDQVHIIKRSVKFIVSCGNHPYFLYVRCVLANSCVECSVWNTIINKLPVLFAVSQDV